MLAIEMLLNKLVVSKYGCFPMLLWCSFYSLFHTLWTYAGRDPVYFIFVHTSIRGGLFLIGLAALSLFLDFLVAWAVQRKLVDSRDEKSAETLEQKEEEEEASQEFFNLQIEST